MSRGRQQEAGSVLPSRASAGPKQERDRPIPTVSLLGACVCEYVWRGLVEAGYSHWS